MHSDTLTTGSCAKITVDQDFVFFVFYFASLLKREEPLVRQENT
jgi:hypothetical protein